MKKSIATILFSASLTGGVLVLAAYASSGAGNGPDLNDRERIERGRYLVHQVGLCIDCHSPRHPNGEFVEDRHLTGSPLAFAPTVPMPWMAAAPKIAGLPAGYSADDTIRFLMTGERPNGRPGVLPPMPPYRFNRADAEAVTAFLKSLGEQPRW